MPWNPSDALDFKQDLSDEQQEQWAAVANEQLEKCLNDGGDQQECEAQAIRIANAAVGSPEDNAMHLEQLVSYTLNDGQAYTPTVANLEGRRHLVVPCVLIRPGVHHGSRGPTLYTPDQLQKSAPAFNGVPVPIYHPYDAYGPVSCNEPGILETQCVGRVFHVHYDASQEKLRGYLYIDEDKAVRISPATLQSIQNGEPLDVSTGIFDDEEHQSGTWRGEQYERIAFNLRPDHLALLPDQDGACSWADGCGVRANKGEGKGQDPGAGAKDHGKNHKNREEMPVYLTKENIEPYIKQGYRIETLQQGYQESLETVQQKLNSLDSELRVYFLEELYDAQLIYRVLNTETGESQIMQRSYSMNEDGTVELGDDPVEVRKTIEYQPVQAMAANSGGQEMEKVDRLIQNSANFTQDDRDWLSNLSEDKLDKLFPCQEPAANSQGQLGPEQIQEILRGASPDQALQLFPDELRDTFAEGLNLNRQKRQELIQNILHVQPDTNAAFTQQELEGKSTQELGKLWSMAKTGRSNDQTLATYSGMGAGGAPTTHGKPAGKPLLPTDVQERVDANSNQGQGGQGQGS